MTEAVAELDVALVVFVPVLASFEDICNVDVLLTDVFGLVLVEFLLDDTIVIVFQNKNRELILVKV